MIGANPYRAVGYQLLKLEPHLHTRHSDGQHGVAAMLRACRAAGYDAVAVTDHNTTSGLAEAERVAADAGLILIPGVEVTTFRGHAVALGVWEPPEWRDLEVRGIDALADDVHARGGVVSVCHPVQLGSPWCSGCTWEWPVKAQSIDLWEVFSAPLPGYPHTELSLLAWRQQLARGGTPAPVAAGDVHSREAALAQRPATYVYVHERSRAGVLEALRRRRLFASTGPRLDFWVEGDGRAGLVGDELDPGRQVGAVHIEPTPETGQPVLGEVTLDSGRCLYAELRGPDAALLAVSAPIWTR